ncbi:hypothetical protein [Corynebacterium glyciniphilum]|uniref:Putative secreted protein n=1 Tax=Corynebacterium glyciniphilum AJ 3170 TaxID=1404245 RepID=X5EEL8_9CORY|nr:hypothetical protein [Corynebacterium glyciniphilum]AHW65081.1 Putative secreted protein [Corynebacterium glyciniphilum AJ 3170]
MTDKTLRRTCAALTAAGLLLGVAACSSDDADSEGATSSESSGDTSGSAVSDDPADMILTDSDTPAGYEWNNVADVLEDGEEATADELRNIAGSTRTEPEQCGSLAPRAVSILATLQDNPDTAAAVEFLPQDENDPGVINAMISTDPENTGMALPDDLSECASFTQSSEMDPDSPAVNYQTEVSDADVLGAEDVHVITVVNDSDSPSGDNPASVVVGRVDDVVFRINASGVEEPQLLLDLVDRQVDRIRGTDPDER